MNFLERWAAAIIEGRAPDPRTTRGKIMYSILGLGIGLFIGGRLW